MELGTEVGLGPGHIVLDGEPVSLPQKGDRVPQFSAHFYCGKRAVKWLWCCRSIVANGWMHQDTTWYGGDIVLDGDPAPPCLKWYGP